MNLRRTASPIGWVNETQLMEMLWRPEIRYDFRKLTQVRYPWGEQNTPLHAYQEPRSWQIEGHEYISDRIRSNLETLDRRDKLIRKEKQRIHRATPPKRGGQPKDPLARISLSEEFLASLPEPEIIRIAISSGRGIGKGAFFAQVSSNLLTAVPGAGVTVTANSEGQLKTKTLAESQKWHTLAANKHWFDHQALSVKCAPWFKTLVEDQLKIDCAKYGISAALWKEEDPESFAGEHNVYGLMSFFDECSNIPRVIWDVDEGCFTEINCFRIQIRVSQGRRGSGPFFECFHKDRSIWGWVKNIDSRTVEGVAKEPAQRLIDKYGVDSDPVRVEVLGQFPRRGDKQFISRDAIESARLNPLPDPPDHHAPVVVFVDVARFGSDRSCIFTRQGRDARSVPYKTFKGLDNVRLVGYILDHLEYLRSIKKEADALGIDGGAGAGVIDILRSQGVKVHEILFGSAAHDKTWANRRTELWALARDWLPMGCIPDSDELAEDLSGPEFDYKVRGDAIMLEPKEQMLKRGLQSPDVGDGLAGTFAMKVPRRDLGLRTRNITHSGAEAVGADWDPLEW